MSADDATEHSPTEMNEKTAKIASLSIGLIQPSDSTRGTLRDVFSTETAFSFYYNPLCCLGHPRWRMFKIQLNNSGLYMFHDHHLHIRKSKSHPQQIVDLFAEELYKFSTLFIAHWAPSWLLRIYTRITLFYFGNIVKEASHPAIVIIINCSFSTRGFFLRFVLHPTAAAKSYFSSE